jgi:hypothetical protein
MRYFLIISSLTILIMFELAPGLKAQNTKKIINEKQNYIDTYVGIFDVNLNYERKILQRPQSSGNLRLGFGYAMFLVAGEGYYINGAFVQLFGVKNSHLELNAGVKYMLTNSISDPAFSDKLLPDIFIGYRFDKPTGGLIFRAGLNYPTVINLGVGYKF